MTVVLQNSILGSAGQTVHVEAKRSSDGLVLFNQDCVLGANGALSITPSQGAIVDVKISKSGWLSDTLCDLNFSLAYTNSEPYAMSLRNGDCNNDAIVDIADYTIVADAFDATPADEWWDARADLWANGIIDISDYMIVSASFDSVSSTRYLSLEGRNFLFSFPEPRAIEVAEATGQLTISGSNGTTGTVTNLRTSFSQAFTIASGKSIVNIPASQMNAAIGTSADLMKVTANSPVNVFASLTEEAGGESTSLIPLQSLGLDFVVPSWPTQIDQSPFNRNPSSKILITAPYVDSSVTIVPTVDVNVNTAAPMLAGEASTVTIPANQTLTLATNLANKDLSGTTIVATRPIAVSSVVSYIKIPTTAMAPQHLWEMVPGTDLLGAEYVTSNRKDTPLEYKVQVVAARMNTVVSVTDSANPIPVSITLARGESHVFSVSGAAHLSGNKPFLCSQLSQGGLLNAAPNQELGDPSMTVLPSTDNFQSRASFVLPNFPANSQIEPQAWKYYATVVAQTDQTGSIKLNNQFIASALWEATPSANYKVARIQLTQAVNKFVHPTGVPSFAVLGYGLNARDNFGIMAGLSMVSNGGSKAAPLSATSASATPTSSSSIHVIWSHPGQANILEGFYVYRMGPTEGVFTKVGTVGPLAREFTDISLNFKTLYEYKVVAVGDQLAPASNIASATTWDIPPATPNLDATALGMHQIQLDWTPSPVAGTAETYRIEWRTGNGAWALQGVHAEPLRQAVHSGLLKNTTYEYRIKAINSRGESEWTQWGIQATTWDSIPNAPTGLWIEDDTYQKHVLHWADTSTNETGFKIYRTAPNGDTFSHVETVASGQTTFISQPLKGAKLYKYRVTAVNTGGESGWVQGERMTLNPPAPAAPTLNSAEAVYEDEVKLVWADNSTEEDGFYVQRKVGTGTFTTVATLPENTTSHDDESAVPSTSYTYRVLAYNDGGATASNEKAVATPAAPPAHSTYLREVILDNSLAFNGTEIGATIRLSKRTTVDVAVSLHYDSEGLSGPANIVIPNGERDRNIVIQVSALAGPKLATISAQASNWMQEASLLICNSSHNLISNLNSNGGAGAVFLQWDTALDEEMLLYSGCYFSVERNTGAGFEALAWARLRSPELTDPTLSVTMPGQYRVTLRTKHNIQIGPALTSEFLSPHGPAVSWAAAPEFISGDLCASIDAIESMQLFVNGTAVATSNPRQGKEFGQIRCHEQLLPDGELLVYAASRRTMQCTPMVTLTNSSQLSSVIREGVLEIGTGRYPRFRGRGLAGPYNIELRNTDTNAIIRSWHGVGRLISLVWDGKDESGNDAEPGSYNARIYPYSETNSSELGNVWVPYVVPQDPDFVGLVTIQTKSDTGAVVSNNLRREIKVALERVNDFEFVPFVVIGYTDRMDVPPDLWNAVKKWLNSASYFYFNGHGEDDDDGTTFEPGDKDHFVQFGGTRYIYSYNTNPLTGHASKAGASDLVISDLTRFDPMHPEFRGGYRFVWMDACSTASYKKDGPSVHMSNNLANLWGWKSAFGINLSTGGSIICTNGYDFLSYGGGSNSNMYENEFGRFRRKFWWAMGMSNTVADSYAYAITQCDPPDLSIRPYGETFLNLPLADIPGDYIKYDLRGGATVLED